MGILDELKEWYRLHPPPGQPAQAYPSGLSYGQRFPASNVPQQGPGSTVTADLNENAQVVLNGNLFATGSFPNPGAFGALVTAQVIGSGQITVNWTVTLSGTLSGTDANNFGLYINGSLLASSINPAVAGSYPQTAVTLNIPSGGNNQLQIKNTNAGTAGSVYGATLPANGGNGTASITPHGTRYSGYTWQPVNLYVSASTNVNEAQATAYVSYGILSSTPNDAVGQTASGSTGDTCGMSQTVKPGDWISVKWTGGDAGSIATMRITGTANLPVPGATQ